MNAKLATIDALSYKMTAFTDFINLLRLQVNIYHNAKVCGNWQINEHTLGATCFHIVTTGKCHLNVPGHLDTEFNQGDLVIFPHEIPHQMSAIEPNREPQQHLNYSTNLNGTGMLCGEVSFMHRYQNQLLEALPPVLFIKNTESTPWLNQMVNLLLDESVQYETENSVMINRLSEMLFVYALRHVLDTEKLQPGILAIYAHPKLSKAIKSFHDAPEKKWDIALMAQKAGMSRTAFAQTFKKKSLWTVNQYTSWWRMQIAWEKLSAGDKVSDVASQVGYQSEAAFSRAFSKQFQISAGQVRRMTSND